MIKPKAMIKFFRKKCKEKAWRWAGAIPDPRGRQGRQWPLGALLNGLFIGLLAGCRTLERVERLTDQLSGGWRQSFGIDQRIADTTLYDCAGQLDGKSFRPLLHAQIKEELRSKRWLADALPIGVAAIDGKTLATGAAGFHPQAQTSHTDDGRPYGNLRALRAVLISSTRQPCLDQALIPPDTNEMGFFERYWSEFLSAYGHTGLVEAVSLDSGFASLHNANLIDGRGKAYVIALKKNQPELYKEAEKLLGRVYNGIKHDFVRDPEAQTAWEPYQGDLVRRSFFRHKDIEGYLGWTHLKQVWLVVQERKDPQGRIGVEYRYFITSLLWKRLTATQCLRLVRLHWGIENGCNWALDVQWFEDSKAWSGQGKAVEALSWLRLMAYNLVQMLRHGVLRGDRKEPLSWQDVFDEVRWYWYCGQPQRTLEEEVRLLGI
jgi:hypothetical protein